MANNLHAEIVARISANGPMPLAEYMALCLTHPQWGYYTARDPLGAGGDFTTAPEISQLFGEMLAGWCIHQWQQLGEPAAFTLVELGPGRGTLMADVLRVSRKFPAFYAGMQVAMVEASPVLRTRQRETLAQHAVPITWLDGVGDLPPQPTIILANEFFDALPVQQYHYHAGHWHMRYVTLETGALAWLELLCGERPSFLPPVVPEGTIVEHCPTGEAIMQQLALHVARTSGAMACIDYGDENGFGDTLQALRAHHFHNPLVDPGEADLTTHVRFGYLRAVAEAAGLHCPPLQTQQAFLESCGIRQRAEVLCRSASESTRDTLLSGLDRLTNPVQMGPLFKVFLCHS